VFKNEHKLVLSIVRRVHGILTFYSNVIHQDGQVLVVISLIVPAFQIVLVVDIVTQLIA